MRRFILLITLVLTFNANASDSCVDLSGSYLLGTYENGQELTIVKKDCLITETKNRFFVGGSVVGQSESVWKTDGIYRKSEDLSNETRVVYDLKFYTSNSLKLSYVLISKVEPVEIIKIFEEENYLDESSDFVTLGTIRNGAGEILSQRKIVAKRIKGVSR